MMVRSLKMMFSLGLLAIVASSATAQSSWSWSGDAAAAEPQEGNALIEGIKENKEALTRISLGGVAGFRE